MGAPPAATIRVHSAFIRVDPRESAAAVVGASLARAALAILHRRSLPWCGFPV
jgi:hypothetical protein